jgi:hypothetical protein
MIRIELFFPIRKSKQHPNDKPWITSELRSLIQQRQQATDKDPKTFRKLRNKVNRLNNRLPSSFFERKVKNCETQVRGGNPLNSSLAFLREDPY